MIVPGSLDLPRTTILKQSDILKVSPKLFRFERVNRDDRLGINRLYELDDVALQDVTAGVGFDELAV